jgi:hypothetical protein
LWRADGAWSVCGRVERAAVQQRCPPRGTGLSPCQSIEKPASTNKEPQLLHFPRSTIKFPIREYVLALTLEGGSGALRIRRVLPSAVNSHCMSRCLRLGPKCHTQ